jgi:hypothetical protein
LNSRVLIEKNTSPAYIEVLLDLIQMFRDKDTIFYLTAKLLKRIVVNADKYVVLCRKRENMKRIKGVYSVSIKKAGLSKSKSGAASRSKDRKEMQRGVTYLEHCLQQLTK